MWNQSFEDSQTNWKSFVTTYPLLCSEIQNCFIDKKYETKLNVSLKLEVGWSGVVINWDLKSLVNLED